MTDEELNDDALYLKMDPADDTGGIDDEDDVDYLELDDNLGVAAAGDADEKAYLELEPSSGFDGWIGANVEATSTGSAVGNTELKAPNRRSRVFSWLPKYVTESPAGSDATSTPTQFTAPGLVSWDPATVVPNYVAIATYEPQNFDEVPLMPGDKLYIAESWPDGWVYGENLSRLGETSTPEGLRIGILPGNFVEKYIVDDLTWIKPTKLDVFPDGCTQVGTAPPPVPNDHDSYDPAAPTGAEANDDSALIAESTNDGVDAEMTESGLAESVVAGAPAVAINDGDGAEPPSIIQSPVEIIYDNADAGVAEPIYAEGGAVIASGGDVGMTKLAVAEAVVEGGATVTLGDGNGTESPNTSPAPVDMIFDNADAGFAKPIYAEGGAALASDDGVGYDEGGAVLATGDPVYDKVCGHQSQTAPIAESVGMALCPLCVHVLAVRVRAIVHVRLHVRKRTCMYVYVCL